MLIAMVPDLWTDCTWPQWHHFYFIVHCSAPVTLLSPWNIKERIVIMYGDCPWDRNSTPVNTLSHTMMCQSTQKVNMCPSNLIHSIDSHGIFLFVVSVHYLSLPPRMQLSKSRELVYISSAQRSTISRFMTSKCVLNERMNDWVNKWIVT